MSRGLHIILGALASATLLLLVSWWHERRMSQQTALMKFQPEPTPEWHPESVTWREGEAL